MECYLRRIIGAGEEDIFGGITGLDDKPDGLPLARGDSLAAGRDEIYAIHCAGGRGFGCPLDAVASIGWQEERQVAKFGAERILIVLDDIITVGAIARGSKLRRA